MTTAIVNNDQWISGLKSVSNTYELIGPVKDKFGYCFKTLSKNEEPDFNFVNTITSPKNIVFPQNQNMIEFLVNNSYKNQKIKSSEHDFSPRAIVGIRPCDAKSNLILKMNFDTHDVKDPYWLNLYNSTTFVGLACNSPCDTCFCTSTDSSPYAVEGLDIIIYKKENKNYLIKTITEKGSNFLELAGWKKLSSERRSLNIDDSKLSAENKMQKIFQSKHSNLKKIEILDLYNAPFWEKIAFSCLNCGICTFICPTCWCYDIQDELYKESGIRSKNWDSCMFPLFTLHTTGHNPRNSTKHRIRQRFMHKLKYFLDKYKQGIMCVGCGRCIRSCPVNIDIREIYKLMIDFKSKGTCIDKKE